MTARTVAGAVSIWLRKEDGPQHLTGTDREIVANVACMDQNSDMSSYGYTRVGMGTLSFELPTLRGLVDSKAEALRAEIQKTRADAQMKVTRLEADLQKLLAIEFDGSAS